jgi:hypothetical protein
MLNWFEPLLYLDPVSTENPGYCVVYTDNVGDALTFKILKKTWSQLWLDQQQMPVITIKEQITQTSILAVVIGIRSKRK